MKRTITTLTLILFSLHFILAQHDNNISEKTKLNIYTEAYKTIMQYQECINKIGSLANKDHEIAKAHVDRFLNLFIDRKVSVHNDLDPRNSLSEIYESETYANNIILWYKNGIQVELDFDNAKVLNIIQHTDHIYSIDIQMSKKTVGTYIDNSYVNKAENLNFSIAFSMENQAKPSNFKFARIKEAGSEASIKTNELYNLSSEKISEEELQVIHEALEAPLKDYCNFLTLIGSTYETESDKEFYKERFLSIFKNSEILVVNDLNKNTMNKQIPVSNYLTQFSSSFGQSNIAVFLDLDSTSFRNINILENDTYATYVILNKKIGSAQMKWQSENIIKIEFSKKEGSYTDFKIADITNSTILENESNVILKQEEVLHKISRKGFSIEGKIGNGTHCYINKDLENIPVNDGTFNSYDWNKKNNFKNILAEVSIAYYPFEKIGFSSGIGYSNASTTYSLKDAIAKEKEERNELIGVMQYPFVTANYDSILSFNTFYIPLHCHIHSSSAGDFGFHGTIGASLEFIQSATYKRSGNFKRAGVLKDTSSGIIELLPEYSGGFEISGDTTETIHSFSKPSLNLDLSAGVEYYINNFTSITLSMYFSYGLNDLEKDKLMVKNIFNDYIPHESSYFRKHGIFLSVRYKM